MTMRSRWDRVRSAEFFRGKAHWYRAMADHAVGAEREKMLQTARVFEARGQAQDAADARRAASAAEARRAGRRPQGGRAAEDRATFDAIRTAAGGAGRAGDRRQGR